MVVISNKFSLIIYQAITLYAFFLRYVDSKNKFELNI